MTDHQMLDLAAAAGFDHAALIDTAAIPVDHGFRKYCEDNLCGQFGANYTCPPDCGTPAEMEQKLRSRPRALVLQTIWDIPDYRDLSVLLAAKEGHGKRARELQNALKAEGLEGFTVGCGGCTACYPCARVAGKPCRFPDLQVSCMSAYCIHVSGLCDLCGMDYNCGPGKIAFFGLYVFG